VGRVTAGIILSVILTSAPSWAQPPARPSDEFTSHFKMYGTFAEDLAAMMKAAPDSLEVSLGTDLVKVTLLAAHHCGTAAELFMMRDLVRATDRQEVDQFLRLSLERHAEMFDNLVGMVNKDLAWTKSPGMAATANRLKDQLRSTKALFERSRPPQP
jgi:hypothetical protein